MPLLGPPPYNSTWGPDYKPEGKTVTVGRTARASPTPDIDGLTTEPWTVKKRGRPNWNIYTAHVSPI